MRSEEEIKQQRKKASKTAFVLFIIVFSVGATYAIWFKTWIANKKQSKEGLKGNNLIKIDALKNVEKVESASGKGNQTEK